MRPATWVRRLALLARFVLAVVAGLVTGATVTGVVASAVLRLMAGPCHSVIEVLTYALPVLVPLSTIFGAVVGTGVALAVILTAKSPCGRSGRD
ncbi:hypothetical+protein [Methylocapsa aurea]